MIQWLAAWVHFRWPKVPVVTLVSGEWTLCAVQPQAHGEEVRRAVWMQWRGLVPVVGGEWTPCAVQPQVQ